MGMTIADNIDFLNEAKKLFEDIANNPSINETVKTYFIIESLESAIDTMRKYKKIEQIIMDDWDKGYQHSETIQRIKEVMKNGNNNTDDKLQD